ncbi:dihydroorotase [Pyrodictium abyssi]|uniref:dihydroorotase n=1 Tax=Pyrodictium abyssi TaxID=54256 RepID=UPI0030C6CED6
MCGTLVDYRGVHGEGCVVVEDGVIVGITGRPPSAVNLLDYQGQGVYVAPGFIDLHVHLRGLGLSYKEDEHSGTAAAAASGITMVADMPNTVPRLSTAKTLSEKLQALERRSLVDYSVYAGIPGSLEEASRLASMPIAGFKVYPSDLLDRFDIVRAVLDSSDTLIVVHPELPEAEKPLVESNSSRTMHRGCHWETAAVELVASLQPRARVHITHVSCPSALERARLAGFTVDVTPHHLLLQEWDEDCLFRVNPPLRDAHHSMLLLERLLEGMVDAFASDHAPHAVWEKSEPLTCRPGIPWLEAWPQMLYCLVEAGALGLSKYLWLVSRGPARILGLSGYGVLETGARANLTVFRPGSGRVLAPELSKARHIPYFMERRCMEVLATIVGGVVVYHEGVLTGKTGAVNPFSWREGAHQRLHREEVSS